MPNLNFTSAYSKYNPQAKSRIRVNPLKEIFPPLPNDKFQIIYADPPWDYGGKMQFDKTCIKSENIGFEKDIFIIQISNFKTERTNGVESLFYRRGRLLIIYVGDRSSNGECVKIRFGLGI